MSCEKSHPVRIPKIPPWCIPKNPVPAKRSIPGSNTIYYGLFKVEHLDKEEASEKQPNTKLALDERSLFTYPNLFAKFFKLKK